MFFFSTSRITEQQPAISIGRYPMLICTALVDDLFFLVSMLALNCGKNF